MPLYRQGENYEEDMEDTKEPETTEPSTDTAEPPKKVKKRVNLNPKIIGCIIGMTVILIIVLLVAGAVSASKREKERKAAMEESAEIARMDLEFLKDHPEVTMPAVETEAVDTPEHLQNLAVETYSEKELYALRKWGFTANQIEIAARDGISAEGLVKQAKKDREEAQKEALAAVSDTASPEYQNLLDKTWLGGDAVDVSGFTSGVLYDTQTHTENADYVKCEARGTQLFIKVLLDNGKSAFMSMSPVRYNELAETGNIVVEITEMVVGETAIITDIHEIRVN